MSRPDFSPALSDAAIAAAAGSLAQSGFVRLENVFAPEAIAALHADLAHNPHWSRVFNLGEKIWDIDPDKIADFEASPVREKVRRQMMATAREGFQYEHDALRVPLDPAARAARGWLVDHLLDSLNSPAWLDVFRRLTGTGDVAQVDGQATRFLPGHYLTGHDDDAEGFNRIAAYVLGITPRWRTEWGGLLQFHDSDGDVIRGLLPRFNAINMFTVPRVHSVSPVSEFAGDARFAFTGWLRPADA